jgi:hypothetical protein
MAERHEAIVVGRSGGTRVNDKAYFVAIPFWDEFVRIPR